MNFYRNTKNVGCESTERRSFAFENGQKKIIWLFDECHATAKSNTAIFLFLYIFIDVNPSKMKKCRNSQSFILLISRAKYYSQRKYEKKIHLIEVDFYFVGFSILVAKNSECIAQSIPMNNQHTVAWTRQ